MSNHQGLHIKTLLASAPCGTIGHFYPEYSLKKDIHDDDDDDDDARIDLYAQTEGDERVNDTHLDYTGVRKFTHIVVPHFSFKNGQGCTANRRNVQGWLVVSVCLTS